MLKCYEVRLGEDRVAALRDLARAKSYAEGRDYSWGALARLAIDRLVATEGKGVVTTPPAVSN